MRLRGFATFPILTSPRRAGEGTFAHRPRLIKVFLKGRIREGDTRVMQNSLVLMCLESSLHLHYGGLSLSPVHLQEADVAQGR